MSGSDAPRRILAVDFGDRRTGLAASDYTGTIEVPLPPLVGLDDPDCAAEIRRIARERDTEVIVVGLPLAATGEPTKRSRRTEAFVAVLQKDAPCEIATVDESLTTDEAHARLKAFGLKAARRKKLADSVAAMIILERFRRR